MKGNLLKGEIFLKRSLVSIFLFLLTFLDGFSQDSFTVSTLTYRMPLKKIEAKVQFHFRKKSFPLVQKLIGILEEEGVELFQYFDYRPSSTIHVLLDENQTVNNGSASVFPDNVITLITFPALGSSFLLGEDDPIKNLFVHELAHIVHLDQTGGINRVLRKVFGSAGKLMPSAVPRWFSEGVATWAETRFTQGGRQRWPGVRWHVDRTLLDEDSCSQLGCLDSPGSFPYGFGSYWIGADFLSWIEDKREGSIGCLVRENADNLAFFLNHTFASCTGVRATELFARYRRERRGDIRRRQKVLKESDFIKSSLKPLKINNEGPVDLQRGTAISEGKLYYLWHRPRRVERVGVWDLEKGVRESRRVPFFVSSFLAPSAGGAVPVSAQDDHFARNRRRIVDLKSQKTLLPKDIGADYAFAWGDGGKWLYFAWEGDHWAIGEYHREKERGRILHRLPPWVSIKKPRSFNKDGKIQVSFQVFERGGEAPYQLWVWRPGDKKPLVLVRKKSVFTYWDQCGGIHLLKESSGDLELVEVNSLDQIVSKKIRVDWADKIAHMVWDDDHLVLFLRDDPEQAWHLPKGCGQILEELSREVNHQSVRTLSHPGKREGFKIPQGLRDYSARYHMLPSWWGLGGHYENDNLYVTAETSLEDPKRFHKLGLKVEVPTSGGRFDFRGNYTHKFSDFRETYASIGYRYQHIQRGLTTNRSSHESTLALYENFYLSKMVLTPRLSLRKERYFYKASLEQQLAYFPVQGDDFFFQWVGDLRLSRSWNRNHFAHSGVGGGLDIHLKPWSRLSVGLRANYDKLFKKEFGGEILDGGHSFYGLGDRDAFGNEMVTARVHLDGELFGIYSSWGLMPFYVKDVRLRAGIDYVNTDIIWLAHEKMFTREDIHSAWWGVRLKLDLFYFSPGSWDFIQVKLRDDTRYIFSFNVSL